MGFFLGGASCRLDVCMWGESSCRDGTLDGCGDMVDENVGWGIHVVGLRECLWCGGAFVVGGGGV